MANDRLEQVAATLNALRLGEAFDAAPEDGDGDAPEATQQLDAKQHQELMALRANQSKQLSRLDKHIVVMFTDLVGSTQYYERYGDLKGREKVLTHNAILFPIVQQHKGVIVKTIGDAIMCYFEDVTASLKAAARMQHALAAYNGGIGEVDDRIHIRIALNAGVAIAQAGDIYGDVVNVAARIEHQAKQDEILMAGSVAEEGKRTFPIEAAGSATFKGKAEPVALFRLRWREVADQKAKSALPERFDVRELLTRGSHGELFLVEDRRARRVVVVKRLYDFLAEDKDARAAFVAAAKTQMRVAMDGVVHVYDCSQPNEQPAFYEAEMIDGVSLSHLVQRKGAPPVDEAAAIVLRAAAVLTQVHQTGTVHGNLEPDNVLAKKDGKIVLTNFGMGAITAGVVRKGGSPPGSLAFISPEQLLGKDPTPQSDVYSLGALLYYLLAGKEPIEDAASLQGTLVAAQGAFVPLAKACPTAPPQVVAVVNKALSLALRARHQDVRTFALELQRAVGQVNSGVPAFLRELPPKTTRAPAAVVDLDKPLELVQQTAKAQPIAPRAKLGPRFIGAVVIVFALGIGIGLLLAPRPSPTPPPPAIAQLPIEPPPELKAVPHPLASKLEAANVIRHGDAFVVLEGGATVIEWYKDDAPPTIELGRMSTTLSLFALGRLADKGALRSLQEPIATWLPEWQQGKKRTVTLRHLLEHTTGMSAPSADDPAEPASVIRFATAADLVEAPGARRSFNPKAFNLIAAVVQALGGKSLDRYLHDEVTEPLGLAAITWRTDKEQTPIAATGASWTALDLARLGRAFIDGGQAKSSTRAVFSLQWREAAAAPLAMDSSASLLWQVKAPDVLVASDGRGSFWLVSPSRRLVAVRLSRTPLADSHASIMALLPALGIVAEAPASRPTVAKSEAASQPDE